VPRPDALPDLSGDDGEARCHVCHEAAPLQLYAAPFAPTSIAWKCRGCVGIASFEEVSLLLGMAQRHFGRRAHRLVQTLLLAVRHEGEIVPVFRALLADPPPAQLRSVAWTRQAAQWMEGLPEGTSPDPEEIIELCRAALPASRG
jgi:hypothetical protein